MEKLKRENVKKSLAGRVKTVLAVVAAAVVIYWALAAFFGERIGMRTVSAQNDAYLSRRIDQLENRFYGIESRLNRLETPSRPTTINPSIIGGNEAELSLLRSELASMKLRLGEAECALLRVDERTLTSAARASRKRATIGGTENCRLNPGAAIELSARP